MKKILLLVALTTTRFGLTETRLAVTVGGHPAGYATLSQKILPDGGKLVELRMELDSQGRKVRITSEARYDAKAMPLRKFQETIIPGGILNKQVIATFGKNGANVVVLDGDKRTTKSVSLAATASRDSLSEFWFIRDSPKPGQIEQTYQFNSDSLGWEFVKTEYRGRKTIKVEGHTVAVYEVVTTRGDQETHSYLDQQGLPVLVDQGELKMVKIWPK